MPLINTLAGRSEYSLPELAKDLGFSAASYDWWVEDIAANFDSSLSTGQRWHDNFVLICPSLVQAWQWLPLLKPMGKAHTVYVLVRVADELTGSRGRHTVAQLGSRLAASQIDGPAGYCTTKISVGKWVDVHRSAAAALIQLASGSPQSVLNGLRVGITDPRHTPWVAGDPLAMSLSSEMLEPDENDIYPVDMVVTPTALQVSSVRQPAGILVPEDGIQDHSGWSTALPPIDTRCISPHGFEAYPSKGAVVAKRLDGGSIGFTVAGNQQPVCVIQSGDPLDEHAIGSLRQYTYVDMSDGLVDDTPEFAAVLSGLAVAGVPMTFGPDTMPPPLLGSELVASLTAFREQDSPLVRESKSIDMRRHALELFAPASRWNQWAGRAGIPAPADEKISVVLATRRPDRVLEAIRQIDRQSWQSVEIVVVLHGVDIPDQAFNRITAECGREIVVRRAASGALLGEVLNIGVEAASGTLIAKMDDDDWYGTNHLTDLVYARRYASAELTGSQVEFVYLEDLDIVTRRPYEGEQYANHVAGGTMLISKSDLLDVGGWRPVHRAVDRCLLQAVEAAGANIYRTHGQNYVMHRYGRTAGHGGHTWTPDLETFLQNSVQQWTGFTLPPQIDSATISYKPTGRSTPLQSVFSAG